MDINKKRKLIKKYLGINTPDWVIQNSIKMLNEFEDMVLPPSVVGCTGLDNLGVRVNKKNVNKKK